MTVEAMADTLVDRYPFGFPDHAYAVEAAKVVMTQSEKTGLTPYQILNLFDEIEKAFMLSAWA